MFPTGNLVDELDVPEEIVPGGKLKATMITAGIPTVFVNAADIGYTGTELREQVNTDPEALKRFDALIDPSLKYAAGKPGCADSISAE